MTYWVRGFGFSEVGFTKSFSVVFDIEDVNSETFMKALEKVSGLSPYRNDKKIIIESVVKLS